MARARQPRRPLRALCILLLLPLAAPGATAEVASSVVIAELLPDPDDGHSEFIELWNNGTATVELEGWVLRDEANRSFTFPPWSLAPGARVVVWTDGPGDDLALGPHWTLAAVWRNSGDTAILHDPGGSLVDTFTYGPGGHPLPEGGNSLALVDGAWQAGAPTPGRAPNAEGGTASAEVLDVPPRVAFTDAPQHARTATTLQVSFQVEEDNGDPVTWRLEDEFGVIATGAGTGGHTANASTPSAPGPWTLRLHAEDPAGNNATASWNVSLRDRDLLVMVPDAGLAFPALRPGDGNITSLTVFTLENLGQATLEPQLDVSPFRAGGSEIPVDGNLRIGVRPAGSEAAFAWIDYDGPMTALGPLAPGERAEVAMMLVFVPLPLPAGTYGSSFAVVA